MNYLTEILFPSLAAYFQEFVMPRFLEMVRVPLDHKEVFWSLIPLIITLLLVQLYFGRNRQEELGWESAYSNSIILIFVAADLVKHIIARYGYPAVLELWSEAFYKGLIVLAVLFGAVCLFFIDYFHSISKRISFFLSSSLVIVFLAFLAIISVYSDITFDYHTLVATLLFFFVLCIFFKIFRNIVPPSPEAELFLEKKYLERREKLREKEKKLKEHIQIIKKKIGF